MECRDCDRSPDCEYMINGTTLGDAMKGHIEYIKGTDCPLDWEDKKAEEMTHAQAIEAVRALRKKLVCRHVDVKENDKPPLGCRPAYIACEQRIVELADAISRNPDSGSAEKWAREIMYQIGLRERMK